MARKRVNDKVNEGSDNSKSKLDVISDDAKKSYGDNVAKAGSETPEFNHIGTGVFTIDVATFGGWVDGHVGLIYGWEGSAKTTTTIKTIVEAQRKKPDKKVIFLDPETHFDRNWFEKNGVDLEKLIVYSDLSYGEAYADVLDAVVATGEVSLVVIDSIPALIPKETMIKSSEDEAKVGARATLVGRMYMSLLTRRQECINKGLEPATVIFVNQYRDGIGKFSPQGTPTALPGGRAPNFLSSLSIEVKKPVNTMFKHPITGFDAIQKAEHNFKLKKPKSGCAYDKGSFILVKSDYDGYSESDIDDVMVVMAYAKSLGMLGGAGKKQRFFIFPDMYFQPDNGKRAMDVMGEQLLSEPEKYSVLKAVIVALVRLAHGRKPIPSDDYLCGHTGEEIMQYIQQLEEFKRGLQE